MSKASSGSDQVIALIWTEKIVRWRVNFQIAQQTFEDFRIPPHSYAGQWGIVLAGEIRK